MGWNGRGCWLEMLRLEEGGWLRFDDTMTNDVVNTIT